MRAACSHPRVNIEEKSEYTLQLRDAGFLRELRKQEGASQTGLLRQVFSPVVHAVPLHQTKRTGSGSPDARTAKRQSVQNALSPLLQ